MRLTDRIFDARRRLLGMPREAAQRALDLSAPQSALKTAQGFLDLARNSEPVRPTFINEEIGRDRRVALRSTTLAALKQLRVRAAARRSTTSSSPSRPGACGGCSSSAGPRSRTTSRRWCR